MFQLSGRHQFGCWAGFRSTNEEQHWGKNLKPEPENQGIKGGEWGRRGVYVLFQGWVLPTLLPFMISPIHAEIILC